MFKRLKDKLWSAIDAEMASRFRRKPQKKGAAWRLYRSDGSQVFATVEYLDTAGGKFTFAAGFSQGEWPTQADIPQASATNLTDSGFVLINADAYGLPWARVDVELDWQIPSRDLVERALMSREAQPLLAQLGVTVEQNHKVLSYGILESVGVKISDTEFDLVIERFVKELNRVLSASVEPMMKFIADSQRT